MIQFGKGFRRQFFNILPVATTNFLLGAGLSWLAPAIVHFASNECDFPVTTTDISWIASTYFALEATSPIVGGICANKIGRKPSLIIASFFVFSSWITIIFANSSNLIILARVLLGTAAGFQDSTWSIYLGEIMLPAERGIYGSIMVSAVIFGMMSEFLLSLFVSYFYLAVIPLGFSVMGFFGTFFIVEAPQLLLMYDKDEKALKNLAWFRGKNVDEVGDEFKEIKHNIEEEKHSMRSIKHFFQHTSEYKVYIMVVVIFGFCQLTGNMIILSYEGLIMDQYDGIPNGNNLSFIYGLIQFLFVNVSPFLIETMGRRLLLIWGFTSAAVIQTAVTFLFYVDQYRVLPIPYIPWMIVILFNLYGMVFTVFVLPTVYVIKSELFPQELKAVGSICSTVCNAFTQFIIMKFFVQIWLAVGLWANFAIYAIVSVFSVVYVYILIPETKGQSLVEIQKNIAANINKKKSSVVVS